MSTYKCFIIDDEPIAIDIISSYIHKLQKFDIVGTYDNAWEAFEALKTTKIDLVFLDIQMPELTGVELLRSLRHKPNVIFTTAYREYALEGFELDVIDYLLKPISFNRFLQALDKFYTRQTNQAPTPEEIFVRADRKMVKILLDDILYIEGLKDYVKIILKNKTIVTKKLISHIAAELPNEQFIRIHKSFIINKKQIDAITAHDVEIGKYEIPIGRKYKPLVENLLSN